jgi:Icc-related predicted phosphoesterase
MQIAQLTVTYRMNRKQAMRLAAVGDLHVKKTSQGQLQPLLAPVNEHADLLLLCGDLTDYGLKEEAVVLAKELTAAVRIPIVAVLGNHDYESGQHREVCQILTEAGVHLLDGEAYEIQGIGIAGAKGFSGGFGRGTLGAWGEPGIKRFVQEAIDEAIKLEGALARLRTQRRIALLHYAPIRATVEGEPVEIFPFLGTSRLEEPLNRHPVDFVFHGHAHHGALEGRTSTGIPVYNVAMPLLLQKFPGRPPFRVVEVAAAPASETAAALENAAKFPGVRQSPIVSTADGAAGT